MHFSTSALTYLSSALSVIALAPQKTHAGITGFSGNVCNGPAGDDVDCNGACISFEGRHSFLVDGGSGAHCVTMFVDEGCPVGGEGFTFQNEDGNCQTVDTGTPINSFICVPNNVCVL